MVPNNGPSQVVLRLYELAYKHKLSHLSSCITALGIIYKIYSDIKDYHNNPTDNIFILSAGHSALALYVVLEHFYGIDAEESLLKHGVHPHRDRYAMLECSTGSLGCGLPIAVGRALGNKKQTVHCLISDGECAEGSIWESLRFIKEKNLSNLKVYVNMNGYCALNAVDLEYLEKRLKAFLPEITCCYTETDEICLAGINGHYHILKDEDIKMIRTKYAEHVCKTTI